MSEQTRWLTDDEQELWRLLLAATRKIDRGMDETLKAGGRSPFPNSRSWYRFRRLLISTCACATCALSWPGTGRVPPTRSPAWRNAGFWSRKRPLMMAAGSTCTSLRLGSIISSVLLLSTWNPSAVWSLIISTRTMFPHSSVFSMGYCRSIMSPDIRDSSRILY